MNQSSTNKLTILFLNENSLPSRFTQGTIPGKELRLRAALTWVYQVHVISFAGNIPLPNFNKKTSSLEHKIRVFQLPPWPHYLKTLPLIIYGLWHIARYRPAIIEAESPMMSGFAAVLLSKITRIPCQIEIRNTFLSLISFRLRWLPKWLVKMCVNKLQNWTIANAHSIIANSHYYQKLFKHINPHITVVNPGLQYPTQHKTKSSLIRLSYIGRLAPEKGVLLLLEMVIKLKQLAPSIPWKLTIFGDGLLKDTLYKLITTHNLRNKITIAGPKPSAYALAHTDILINPCLIDSPLDMVNAEAAYAGIPVITFGHSGIPETVLHNKTGIIIPEKSAQQLALEAIKLMQNPKLYSRLSKNGPSFAATYYEFSKQVSELDRCYRDIIFHT